MMLLPLHGGRSPNISRLRVWGAGGLGIRSLAHARRPPHLGCIGCCVNKTVGALVLWQRRMEPTPGHPIHQPGWRDWFANLDCPYRIPNPQLKAGGGVRRRRPHSRLPQSGRSSQSVNPAISRYQGQTPATRAGECGPRQPPCARCSPAVKRGSPAEKCYPHAPRSRTDNRANHACRGVMAHFCA